ncbi:response regulator transcription factor [Aneurinibacillus migulanus]|uniref:DNA-binding response regulator, OmpR family, contains REC and winged-helix (WHTH) domain n=1 Tax=Aneurinibacillus migulanus TaxID=47500 RepID=A0A0D1W9S7_ANEMI|nr:response regulator transcription factor [Aneurinibacillus migulanus]KIV55355.1 LuxR family transcriptional regulator [Aneurinibacillus migulanus]KON90676.1 LuxR family transcriptional regulator [Aneurinibacillus migulanus]KON96652.1 LuxR family transcriptional regulator [Aneurinibacillus migulanus]MED0896444.1 response regulator transcription factor [Aneurinibacillus migulanus]MED1618196.1 response regulator transcription factor [Aneurinibacillus migulanus]
MRKTILLVDDESDIIDLLKLFLEKDFDLLEAHDGQAAVELFTRHSVDLAVIDIMMPHLDGFQLLQWIRKQSKLPVIVLSAKNQETDKIAGLGLGADDFITKPFSPLEVVARIQAQLRRTYEFNDPAAEPTEIRLGDLTLDHEACILYKRGEPIALSAIEYKLLKLFMSKPGRIYTKKQIFENVWSDPYIADDNTIMVQISRLRDKIEDSPRESFYLKTVRGLGYRFAKKDELHAP